MTEIKTTIEPDDIEWEMDWSGTNADGERLYPDKPLSEKTFEPAGALAIMLLNEVIFLNSHHWEDAWPKEARATVYLGVNCNDVFAWGSADAEGAGYRDIEQLYRFWRKHPGWGPAVWCMIKRREMPQAPVEKKIRDLGIWDLDALKTRHGLRANHYDGVSGVFADRKYEVYCAWERENGRDPRPFDKDWWSGWNAYVEAHPGWDDEAWEAEDARRRDEWRKANGHED